MKAKKILKISLIVMLIFFVIILTSILIYINLVIRPIKDIDVSLDTSSIQYSKFYDNNNQIIESTDIIKNDYVSISLIPEITKNAFISIEDKEFYNHNGLNYKRILKAGINNVKAGELKEGASTITQQLVKNKFLSNEKTFTRKIKEAYLTKKLEKTESKEKILESYLNTIYFGNGAYGIGSASKIFFDKEVTELNLVESATLAGCIKSPSNYSPINNYENSIIRKNIVLKEMLKDNLITQDEFNTAYNEDINIENANTEYVNSQLDLYSQYVLDEASDILNTNIHNILQGNYKIYTYQDNAIQKIIDEKINNDKYYEKNEFGNIADSLAIVIDNKQSSVSAISGRSKYNLVNFKRQPGSLIKPIFTYAPALEEGLINSKTQILDEKIDYNGYSPNNVGNKFYGYISVEDAVAKSLNIPAIKVSEKVGLNKCKEYVERCGIEFNNKDVGYSIALGGLTDGLTLKNITDTYSVFTNNGKHKKSNFIKKIINNNNETIYSNKMSENEVYNSDTAYLMTDILKYSVKTGTSKKLSNLDFDIAGKTGTVNVSKTNYNTDAYSLAYTTNHTMSVWLGNYSMEKEYNLNGSNNGGTFATEIIRDSFDKIYSNEKPMDFQKPNTVSEIIIDNKSLQEDHIVVLGDNIPERYQIKTLISTRFMPKNHSVKFNTINPFDLKLITYKNSCEIIFETKDYIDYKIYRESNNQTKCIHSIENHNDEYRFIDNDITNNTVYNYYVVATSNYCEEEYVTDKHKVYIEKLYNEILERNNDLDSYLWLFQ